MPQLRDSKGRFLPKDSHPEDLHPELYHVMRAPIWDDKEKEFSADDWTPPKRPRRVNWRVVVGYFFYLILCFGAGTLGAVLGVHI